MKKFIFLFLVMLSTVARAQTGIHVSGRFLLDKCNDTLVLKGVNYPVLDDWAFPASSEKSNEIALSNANSVRICWYINYGQPTRPPFQLSDLDTVITRCRRYGMIPIVDLHDYTCNDVLTNLTSAVNWITSPSVLSLISKHHEYLIFNILNEFGYVDWASNPTAAELAFKNAYMAAVTNLRNSGVHIPLMIDAPDCGTNISRLINICNAMQANDPDHNLVFSAHAYWYAYAGNSPVNFQNLINDAVSSGQPFVLGEIANYQDTLDINYNTVYCAYALNYQSLIPILDNAQIGWIFWAWYMDNCNPRMMTPSGLFSGLSVVGNDIVNNALYGLMQHAHKTNFFTGNGLCTSGISNQYALHEVELNPNPSSDGIIDIKGLGPDSFVEVYGTDGRQIMIYKSTGMSNQKIFISRRGFFIFYIKNPACVLVKKMAVG